MIPLRVENPSGRIPIATIVLIISNTLIYFYQISLGPAEEYFIYKYAAVAHSITTFNPAHPASTMFPPLTLITSQFLHVSLLHLLFNMLFLWVFGDNVEAKLGFIRYILFYLMCGVSAGIFQVVTSPNAAIPLIGSSGAIAGVMGAYFLRFPKAKVQALIIIIFYIRVMKIPAIIYLGAWLILQVIFGAPTLGDETGGVAYFAHIGGFIGGMVLFKVWEKYK
ncbi:MAG: rhomboid family intramembrane serine protease [candidate division Zixibacteria bacterium]|nr:rhomboid family intramembrane serine protease [candidate division Zixibacteria bacterium]